MEKNSYPHGEGSAPIARVATFMERVVTFMARVVTLMEKGRYPHSKVALWG